MEFRCGINKYIAENTSQTPKVLILKIAAIAPLINFHSQRVAAFLKIRGDAEFGRGHPALTVSYFFAIHPNIHGRLYPGKVNINLTPVPIVGQIEIASVRTYRVRKFAIGPASISRGHNVRRVLNKRVCYIGINRFPITFHLPVRGYLNIVPVTYIKVKFVKINRAHFRRFYPVKFPGSV